MFRNRATTAKQKEHQGKLVWSHQYQIKYPLRLKSLLEIKNH